MEITGKHIAIAVIPVLITALTSIADNSLRWRAEMEQKQFDRQTRLIDKLMEVPTAEKRLSAANFYLELGVFSGQYRVEVDAAIDQAQRELAAKEEEHQRALAALEPNAGYGTNEPSPEVVTVDPKFLETVKPYILPLPNTRRDIQSVFAFDKPIFIKAP